MSDPDESERGEPVVGDTILLLFNAHHEEIPFALPTTKPNQCWEQLIDTSSSDNNGAEYPGEQRYPLKDRSLAVLRTKVLDLT